MLKGIILGILIWNVICIIVAFITNENTEKVSICGCGLPIIIIWGISNIVRKIHEVYIKSKYNLYFFCNKDGNSLFSYAMTEEMANKFYIDGENDFYQVYLCSRLLIFFLLWHM